MIISLPRSIVPDAGLHERRPKVLNLSGLEDRHQDSSAVLPYMLTGVRLAVGTAWLKSSLPKC
jgi:hypothetical protein